MPKQYNFNTVSAGIFILLAASLFVLGIWYFLKSFVINQKNDLKDLDREAITNVVVTLILMAIYVPLMVNLGFVFGSAVMIFLMSTYFGNRNFLLGGGISLFLPMVIYLVFLKVLFIELPAFPIDYVIPEKSFIYGTLKFLSNKSFF